jgi:hypothetical protein
MVLIGMAMAQEDWILPHKRKAAPVALESGLLAAGVPVCLLLDQYYYFTWD